MFYICDKYQIKNFNEECNKTFNMLMNKDTFLIFFDETIQHRIIEFDEIILL